MAHSLKDLLLLVFGVIGNLLSLLVFLAPIPTFVKIYRAKSSRGYKSLPYNISFFNCLLWAYYSEASNSTLLLILSNFVGCTIEAVYIVIFIIYGSKKSRIMTTQVFIGMNVVLYSQILLVSHYMFSDANRVPLIGWICVAFSISTYAAPMSSISMVVRTRNVEYMPFALSFCLTLNAGAWICYGILTKNIFIMIPTIVGFFFGAAQMAVYIIYKKKGAAAAAAEAAAAQGNAEEAVEAASAAAELPDIIDESNRQESSGSSRSMPLTPNTTPVAEVSSVAGKIKGRIKKAQNSLRRKGGASEHSSSLSSPPAAPRRAGGRVVELAPTAAPAAAWERYHSRGKRVIEVGESSGSSAAAGAKETAMPEHITRIAEHIAQISEHIVKIAEMTSAPSPPELQAITEESESESTDTYRPPLPPPALVPEHVINIAELTSSLELGMAVPEESTTKKHRKQH